MRLTHVMPLAVAGAIALTAPGAAFAQDDAEQADAGEQNPANRIVCRREPPPAGTRLGGRNICKTQLEWEQIQRENRDALERVQNRNRFGNN